MKFKLQFQFSLFLLAFILVSCFPTSFDESVEFSVLAEISEFSVPDSARSGSVPVKIAGIIGRTTAYSFQEIIYQRTDSLFEFAVYGRRIEKTGEQYGLKDIAFDTTFVLTTNPPRLGKHYFKIYGANGIFSDSTRLY